jgi:hypothetical protein
MPPSRVGVEKKMSRMWMQRRTAQVLLFYPNDEQGGAF